MNWHRQPGVDPCDPAGVGALLDAAGSALGGPPLSGTRFVNGAPGMLALTREIEASIVGADATLYVGFQDAGRFGQIAALYDDLASGGTQVVAFGCKRPHSLPDGVEWVEVPDNPFALENQWFLLTREPAPRGVVGYETSSEQHRGVGAAGSPHRTWEGFATSDGRLVDALIGHLDAVRDRE